MKIITVMLNPAYDVHYNIDNFALYKESYVSSMKTEAGGKAINISRVLHNNGVESVAYIIFGKENYADFAAQLDREKIDYRAFYTDGRIRENITIHSKGDPETRISFDNFYADEKILDEIYKDINKTVDENTIIALGGKVPKGMSMSAVISFLLKLKNRGAKLVIDSKSFGGADLIEVKPWLIKPNIEEIQMFSDTEIKTVEEAEQTARKLCDMGMENVIVSLGADGAVYVSKDYVFSGKVPKINAVSTIGAGDSTVSGFIAAFVSGKSVKECFETAISYGTAACLTEGTLPPRKEDIEKIKKQVTVTEIK